ncbi:hypothetical protein [Streptomyces sp. PmtA]|uniref:hypothetical protein n=1 Tax=Streptomyces sp. PmtA TaxID=3074275 RepID=UPI003FCCED5C
MDRDVLRTLRGAGAALGIAPAGAVNLLAPRAILRGGALSRPAPWLLPSLERKVSRRRAQAARPSLAVSGLGSDGALLGAAHSVIRALLDDPASSAGSAGDV